MKIRSTVIVGFILALTCIPGLRAQDRELIKQIQEFYEKTDRYTESKNLDAYMALFAEDWQLILIGMKLEGARYYIEKMFEENEELWAEHLILDVKRSDGLIKVVVDMLRKGKSGNGGWTEIYHRPELHYLAPEGNSLKIVRTAEIDRARLNYINGSMYKDEQTGFSFKVPENWSIIPSTHPTIQEYVLALAPDMNSVAMFGAIHLPGIPITAQQAIEGDEMLTAKTSVEGTYKLLHSGPIRIFGKEGFETETEFLLPTSQLRHRRRVYLNADGTLYVLCFDAIPSDKWDAVKGGFQSVLDSVKFQDSAK